MSMCLRHDTFVHEFNEQMVQTTCRSIHLSNRKICPNYPSHRCSTSTFSDLPTVLLKGRLREPVPGAGDQSVTFGRVHRHSMAAVHVGS
jgi:hypothetical protein